MGFFFAKEMLRFKWIAHIIGFIILGLEGFILGC
jgi:hypothetical protein